MATNDIHGFCKKQKAFAWAKYYESSRKRLEADHKHYNELKALEGAGSIPVHIKEALATMGAELKKVWECPVCIDIIEPTALEITNCGHFYCKPCLVQWKTVSKNRGDEKWKCGLCNKQHKYDE